MLTRTETIAQVSFYLLLGAVFQLEFVNLGEFVQICAVSRQFIRDSLEVNLFAMLQSLSLSDKLRLRHFLEIGFALKLLLPVIIRKLVTIIIPASKQLINAFELFNSP